jgi:hypothetical protein
MKCVWDFINNEDDDQKYHVVKEYATDVMVFMCHGEWTQLAVSICIKRLPTERIKTIWAKLFPNHDIDRLIQVWEEDGNNDSDHIIYGYDHDEPNETIIMERMKKYEYTADDVKTLINDLTLVELANIVPEIKEVTYKNV